MRRHSLGSRGSEEIDMDDHARASYFPLGAVAVGPRQRVSGSRGVDDHRHNDIGMSMLLHDPRFEDSGSERSRYSSVLTPPEDSVRLQRSRAGKRPTLWGMHMRHSARMNGQLPQLGDSGSDEDHIAGTPSAVGLSHRATVSHTTIPKALNNELFKEALLPFIAGSDPGDTRAAIYNTGFMRNAWKRAPTINVNFDHGVGQCVFSADSKVMIVWDLIMMVAIAWTIIVTPYEIALLTWETANHMLYYCHMVVDYIFLFDLVVNFNLIFETSGDEGTYEVADRAAIRNAYLQGWFLFDLVSAFPFTLFPSNFQKRIHGFQEFFRTCRLVRLLRISKLRRRNLLSRPIMPFWLKQVCILLFISFISVHLFACVWGALAVSTLDAFAQQTWLDAVIKLKLDVPESVKESPFQVYTWSVYFAITLITTVGFGDVTPQSQLEVGVATIGICLGSIIWAYILSSLFTVLSRRDPHRTDFENMMDELKSMMEDHSLPGLLVFDVQNYFCECEKLWKLAKRRSQLIERMSPMLRGRVSLALCAEWIAKVGYIRDLFAYGVPGTTGFVAEIASKLEAIVFSAGEKLEALAIYIIRKGIVGQGSRVLSVGDVVGADFMAHNPQNRMPFYPVSLTISGTLFIVKRDFGYILKRFPQQAKSIRMYTLWLACKYGLARELRRAAARRQGGSVEAAPFTHVKEMFGAVRLQGDRQRSPHQPPQGTLPRTSTKSTLTRTASHAYTQRDGTRGASLPELDDILNKLDYLTYRMDDVTHRLSRMDSRGRDADGLQTPMAAAASLDACASPQEDDAEAAASD